MGDLHHLHRMVALPVKSLDDIVRDHGAEAQHREPMRFVPSQERKPSTFERIAGALGSDRFLTHFIAFTAGSLFTCGMALVWARVGL